MTEQTESEKEASVLLVPAREAAATLVRCHPDLMGRLRQKARDNYRSLNAELVARLARSLDDDDAATAA